MSKFYSINIKKILLIFIVLIMLFSTLNIFTTAVYEALPDLTIAQIDCSNEVGEGEVLDINVQILNIGDKNISSGTTIRLGIYIDNVLVASDYTTDGLKINKKHSFNLTWTAKSGDETQRLLRIIVDYLDTIQESNENNNVHDKYISVEEKDTELEIIDIDFLNNFQVGESTDISVKIKNYGKSTSNTIYVKLYTDKEGKIQILEKNNGLDKNEEYDFEFFWIPEYFGSQSIVIDVYIIENEIHDSYETTVQVKVGELIWWNANWHYRHFLIVEGNGNFSTDMNFSELLNEIGIESYEFENETIRIVQYNTDGTVAFNGEIDVYNFQEDMTFDNMANAKGKLLWKVTGSGKKYFCIYFDVKDNNGQRTSFDETDHIVESGDTDLYYSGFVGGWWTNIVKPTNGSFALINEPVDISVHTVAKVDNVLAFIFLKEDQGHYYEISLNDDGTSSNWTYDDFTFDREGNWTIRINSTDNAGYNSEIIEHDFYVGKPDLETINITIETDWVPTSPVVYKNDIVTITSFIRSHYATFNDVTVNLSIYDIDNNVTFYNDSKSGQIILKDSNESVEFDWLANRIGRFTIKITVISEVDELDVSNNDISLNITVKGWPDLYVEDVIIPVSTVEELDKVKIYAIISNDGEGKAKNYQIGLCTESSSHETMTYTNVVATSTVSIDAGESKHISLYWDSAKPGKWMVGVKIITSDTKRDTNIVNNQYFSNDTLNVKGIERNPPDITDVDVTPDNQEQGKSVKITAMITDDTGLASVSVVITTPKNINYSDDMIRTSGNNFNYVFDQTENIGTYEFKIVAIDTTFHANNATANGNFLIKKDVTSPMILYYDVRPHIQSKGKEIEIFCIATDNIEIKKAEMTIINPENNRETRSMTWSSLGKYTYKTELDVIGKYEFFIIVTDDAGNDIQEPSKYFWITIDEEDIDNDGMPNWWEEKYNLDPEDPDDADDDKDGDGQSNLKEFEKETNPNKDSFSENIAVQIKENSLYLIGSVIFFIILIIMLLFIIWRKRR